MKLLLDQGLPRSSAAILREAGFDVVHAGEISLATAEDELIRQRGRSEGRIVVTLDADFHPLMALSGATSPSVIRLRIEGLKAERLAELLQLVLRQCAEDLEAGALVIVPVGPWRLKRLPAGNFKNVRTHLPRSCSQHYPSSHQHERRRVDDAVDRCT